MQDASQNQPASIPSYQTSGLFEQHQEEENKDNGDSIKRNQDKWTKAEDWEFTFSNMVGNEFQQIDVDNNMYADIKEGKYCILPN